MVNKFESYSMPTAGLEMYPEHLKCLFQPSGACLEQCAHFALPKKLLDFVPLLLSLEESVDLVDGPILESVIDRELEMTTLLRECPQIIPDIRCQFTPRIGAYV
jgi:hypothetical protein